MASDNPVGTREQAPNFKTAVNVRLAELGGLTKKALADRLQLARNTVSLAINHETMLPGVKQRIREVLGL